jgi:hypothetical protein
VARLSSLGPGTPGPGLPVTHSLLEGTA